MTQAALGSSVAVETLEEPQTIEVSAGTQAGHVVKIKGLGVPHLRGRGRGALFAHLVVDTPTQLDETQADLLRQLAAARGEEVNPPGSDGVFSRIRSAFG
jgi:molecular chaperone DnaJ